MSGVCGCDRGIVTLGQGRCAASWLCLREASEADLLAGMVPPVTPVHLLYAHMTDDRPS